MAVTGVSNHVEVRGLASIMAQVGKILFYRAYRHRSQVWGFDKVRRISLPMFKIIYTYNMSKGDHYIGYAATMMMMRIHVK